MSGSARIVTATGALLLAGCQTAFVPAAPTGRYDLVQVDGRGLPHERMTGGCRERLLGGTFDLDSIARRFAIELAADNSCTGAATLHESGSYLRRGGMLTLESDSPAPRTLIASETGRSISLAYRGLRLRFQQRR